MTALERAARALCASIGSEGSWDRSSRSARQSYVKHARSVLLAVREPGSEIEARGYASIIDVESETMLGEAFPAMIDAILNEEPK